MENLSPKEYPDSIIFGESCSKQLNVTRKWTKFLSIVGFVFLTYMAIIIGLLMTQYLLRVNGGVPILVILPLILLAVLYFFPIYFLSKFSVHAKAALKTTSGEELAYALKYLKLHYTFVGVIVIMVTVFYVIGIITMFKTSGGINFFKFWQL